MKTIKFIIEIIQETRALIRKNADKNPISD